MREELVATRAQGLTRTNAADTGESRFEGSSMLVAYATQGRVRFDGIEKCFAR